MKKIGVLVVDNERSFIGLLEEFFRNNEYIQIIHHAENGIRGLEILQKYESDIDLIILDLIMPECDGIAFLDVLKNLNIDKKVVVITSFQLSDMIHQVLEYRVNYFMLKPFALEDLEKRILKIFEIQETKVINLEEDYIQLHITNLLREVGMPANVKGYHYLRDAILLVVEKPDILESVTKELYPEVANHFDSTTARVERSMRHAIEISFTRGNLEKIEEIFRYSMDSDKAKPTNSEFISIMAEKVSADLQTEIITV